MYKIRIRYILSVSHVTLLKHIWIGLYCKYIVMYTYFIGYPYILKYFAAVRVYSCLYIAYINVGRSLLYQGFAQNFAISLYINIRIKKLWSDL